MSDILKDSRFAKYLSDPRYRQIPKHERKVKLDKRFKSMFQDHKFKVKYTVDKRGRPINETSTENLRKYYDLDESEDSKLSDSESDNSTEKEVNRKSSAGTYVQQSPCDDAVTKPLIFVNDKLVRGILDHKTKNKLLDLEIDYARGEGVLQTDSSSEEESSDLEEDSELEHEWGELDADAETTDESTKRIAICNMDWDNIKAIDLMVLLNSFLPSGGFIHRIVIYPSEYGLKRMQEEEVRGPIELTEDKADVLSDDEGNEEVVGRLPYLGHVELTEDKADVLSDDEGNEEGSTYHMEKLRRYQLNRLKYYYAVVECDSVATADKLYSECDGMEYESSATRLDMRFIPDDVTFDQEPREVCNKMPDMTKYKSRLFTTTALQQAKVELTWDATNPNRTEVLKGALEGKIDDLDLKDYLASSSDSEDENSERPRQADDLQDNNTNDPIEKYKMLLEDIEKKEETKKNKDMEMEITWGLGIKDKAEELVKKKMNEETKVLTPFQKLLKKRQEKKKQKKHKQKEKSDQVSDSDNSDSDDIPSDVDMNDPYFAEEFNNADFKKVKSKEKKNSTEPEIDVEEEKRKAELELLLDDNDGKAHFSLKKIQKSENDTKSNRKKKLKQKMKEEKKALTDFEINVNDDRFSALYNSHLFNIDPTDPNYKKTKNMDKLIQEKLKRRPAENPLEDEVQSKISKQDAKLNVLLKDIKRKTKTVTKN